MPSDRDRLPQGPRHVVHGGPHHIEVVGTDVGDDADRASYQAKLRDRLKLGGHGHAFEDDCLGPIFDRAPDDPSLLDDVRLPDPEHIDLGAVRVDHPSRCARRLRKGSYPAGAKPGRDEAGHR